MLLQIQVYVDSLVKKAYDNWDQVVEYDGKSLVNAEQNNSSVESENELHLESIDYGSGLDHQLQLPVPMPVPSEQQMNSGMAVGGKHSFFHELQFDGSSLFVLPPSFSFGTGVSDFQLRISNIISHYSFLMIMK